MGKRFKRVELFKPSCLYREIEINAILTEELSNFMPVPVDVECKTKTPVQGDYIVTYQMLKEYFRINSINPFLFTKSSVFVNPKMDFFTKYLDLSIYSLVNIGKGNNIPKFYYELSTNPIYEGLCAKIINKINSPFISLDTFSNDSMVIDDACMILNRVSMNLNMNGMFKRRMTY